jgi:hypothetical protein
MRRKTHGRKIRLRVVRTGVKTTVQTAAMSRPATGRKGQNVTVYLNRVVLSAAKKHAFECEVSLSEMITRLLRRELSESMGSHRTNLGSGGGR